MHKNLSQKADDLHEKKRAKFYYLLFSTDNILSPSWERQALIHYALEFSSETYKQCITYKCPSVH